LENISNQGLHGLLLNFRLLFSLHSQMDDIFKLILDALQGAGFWIALLFLAAGYVCWHWIGTGQEEQPVLRRRMAF
jgi:hypothetical protein